jgi:hypothetical protein
MTENRNRIQILAPEELGVLIDLVTEGGEQERAELAVGLLRLFNVMCGYMPHDLLPGAWRVGSVLPSSRSRTEIDWTIMQNPDPNGLGGQHIINGGLIRNRRGIWGIHT